MAPVLAFWAVALLVAALALPFVFALLRRLPDAGAGFSFALGLTLTGYGYFVLRVLSVLPPGRGGYVLAVALLALAGVCVAARDRRFASTLRRQWPSLLTLAGLFTLFFFAFVAYRSYVPEIHGTEQPMDFMYLNATMQADQYPPEDPWLAGESASYYYFGYLQVGVLTSVAGAPASVGYNLGLAYTFAAAATAAASLGFALARWALGARARAWALAGGVAAVVLLLFVGSLSAIPEWTAAHGHTNQRLYDAFGIEWMIECTPEQLADSSAECFRGATNPRTIAWYPTEYFGFWWRGTRIIRDTITEFPFFSFLLGDLHPHVMSIPLVLLATGLALAWWRGRGLLTWREHLSRPWPTICVAVLLGAMGFENTWDITTFCAVFAAAVALRNLRRAPPLPALRGAAGYLAPLFVLAIAAYLPWYVTFSSQAEGLYAYAGKGTRPQHAFLQFGPLVAAALVALTWALRRRDTRPLAESAIYTSPVVLGPLMGWLLLAAVRGDLAGGIEARTGGGWLTLAAYGGATWMLAATCGVLAARRHAAAPLLGLAAVGALLLFGAELFLIRDVFYGASPRLNTVFKLTYQAWLLLAVAGGAAVVVAWQSALRRRRVAGWLGLPVFVLVAGGLVFPLLALPNRSNGFDSDIARSIDGLVFLARTDPDEYALTQWIRENAGVDDVIIEASGRRYGLGPDLRPTLADAAVDYSDASRISARTGVSTLIGWYFHEVQWRGDTPENAEEFRRRQDQLDAVYMAASPAEVLDVLRESGARYIVVGRQELGKFPGSTLPDFASFLDVAFESGDLRVYEVPRYEVVETS